MDQEFKVGNLTISRASPEHLETMHTLMHIADHEKFVQNSSSLDVNNLAKRSSYAVLASEIRQPEAEAYLVSGPPFATQNPLMKDKDTQYYGFGVFQMQKKEMKISRFYTVKNPEYATGQTLLGGFISAAVDMNVPVKLTASNPLAEEWFMKVAGFRKKKDTQPHKSVLDGDFELSISGNYKPNTLILSNPAKGLEKLENSTGYKFGKKNP